MKPVIRWPTTRTQSRLRPRRSYKPSRVIRIRPALKVALVLRPAPASPQISIYEKPIEFGFAQTGARVIETATTSIEVVRRTF